MDVSLIFVNYKTNNLLYDAINSIHEKCNGCSYEIIVVDNSVDDDIYADLEEKKDKYQYKLIKSPANIGIGNGGNLGAKYASGDYLLFLNSDIIFINDAVTKLFEYIKCHPNVGIVGGNLYNKDLTPNITFHNDVLNKYILRKHFNYIGWALSKLKKKEPTFNYSDNPIIVKRMIIGAVLMISKIDFEILGGYDKDIFMYGEESLLCYRVQHELNKLIVNVPSAKVIHLDGGSYTDASVTREKARVNGDFIYFSKSLGKDVAINIYRNRAKILKLKISFAKLKRDKSGVELMALRRNLYLEKVAKEKQSV